MTHIVREQAPEANDDSSDSDDSIKKYKKSIALDSMKSYLDNILNVAVKTVSNPIRETSDKEDETSIQEILTFRNKMQNGKFSKR